MASLLLDSTLACAQALCASVPRTQKQKQPVVCHVHIVAPVRTEPGSRPVPVLISSFAAQAPLLRGKKPASIRGRRPAQTVSQLKSLEGTEAQAVFGESGEVQSFPASPGVYAVYDSQGTLQYMGLSRRLAASIQVHAEALPDLCASVKVALVDAANRDALTAAWKAWMEEHVGAAGQVPPGNEAGESRWTAKAVRRSKPEIRLTPGAHVELTVPITELVDKVVRECKVVAFIKGTRTAPECGFSHRMLTLLNEQRVDYETLNVLDEDHNPGLREAIKAYSQWPTIPQLYVNGEFVGGADILEEMATSGELKALFGRR